MPKHFDDIVMPNPGLPIVVYHPDDTPRRLSAFDDVAVLPGSFDPLHVGHTRLKAIAEDILGQSVVYELSITNVEKSILAADDVRRRLGQFADSSIVITEAPRFVDKAKLFPGCCFVVGYDTAERIVSPAFYGRSESEMLTALGEIRWSGNRFLVGGRLSAKTQTRQFACAGDLQVPTQFQDMFEFIPEATFREDVSSTQIRAEQKNG